MNQSIPKRTLGQSGDDGNTFLRTKRIYIQLSPEEKLGIALTAKIEGFNSMAQYVRQMALSIGAVDNHLPHSWGLKDCHSTIKFSYYHLPHSWGLKDVKVA